MTRGTTHKHPLWRKARHLAWPMLLCCFITPIAFNGVPIYGRSFWLACGVLAISLVMMFVYVVAAWLNYRHTMSVLGRGLCLDCGYELWPTIKSGRWECPECGRRISSRMAERVWKLRSVDEMR